MADEREVTRTVEAAGDDGDSVAVSLFAHDLSEYAGEWIAATPRGVVAHNPSLRELRKAVSQTEIEGDIRFYAVPAEVQAT